MYIYTKASKKIPGGRHSYLESSRGTTPDPNLLHLITSGCPQLGVSMGLGRSLTSRCQKNKTIFLRILEYPQKSVFF